MKLAEEIVSGKMKTGLKAFGIVAFIGLLVFFVLAEIASRGAAMIFNNEMEKQKVRDASENNSDPETLQI